jgi:hypothetical protein
MWCSPWRGKSALAISATVVAVACGAPVSPTIIGTPAGTSGGPRNASLSGTVADHADGAAVAGATVLLGGAGAVTDAAGRFTINGVPDNGSGVLTVSAGGYLFRGLGVSLAPARASVPVDLIRDAPPFDLQFYRWFVRNGFESIDLQSTRPWTMDPSFYVKMTVEGSGAPVAPDVVQRIRELFEKSVPELSGGRRRMAAFETGTATRPVETGWVNLTFYAQLGAVFGQSTVGGNSGTISIRYGMVSTQTTNPFGCYTPEVGIADHEVTHTMGYWHTPNVNADTFSGAGCPGTWPAHVRYHAALMYSRPAGNRDPDIDPPEVLNILASSTGARQGVSCVWTVSAGSVR